MCSDKCGQVLGALEELKDMLGTVQSKKKEVKLNGHMFLTSANWTLKKCEEIVALGNYSCR